MDLSEFETYCKEHPIWITLIKDELYTGYNDISTSNLLSIYRSEIFHNYLYNKLDYDERRSMQKPLNKMLDRGRESFSRSFYPYQYDLDELPVRTYYAWYD